MKLTNDLIFVAIFVGLCKSRLSLQKLRSQVSFIFQIWWFFGVTLFGPTFTANFLNVIIQAVAHMSIDSYANLLLRLAGTASKVDYTKTVLFGPTNKYHPINVINFFLCTAPSLMMYVYILYLRFKVSFIQNYESRILQGNSKRFPLQSLNMHSRENKA